MSEFKNELKNDVVDKETGLSEKEMYFLSILFDECSGSVAEAMKQSGLHKETTPYKLRYKLKDKIAEASKAYLSASSARASVAVVRVLDEPELPGTKNILEAAKQILDRGGVFKEEKSVQVQEHNIFILPAKDKPEEDD